jgi:hypothetical protein
MPFEPGEHDAKLWVPDSARARVEKTATHVVIDNQTDLPNDALEAYMETTGMFGFGQETRYLSYPAEGTMMARSKWRPPRNVIEEIAIARDYVERDDDVGNAVGAILAAAYHGGYSNQHEDEQVEHTFGEMSEDIGLSSVLHDMHRELLISSQINTVTLFTRETYAIRPENVTRVISRSVAAPQIGVLPAERVRVLGDDTFGKGQLAYVPHPPLQEWLRSYFSASTSPAAKRELRLANPVAAALFIGKAQVPWDEVIDQGSSLMNAGMEMYLLNPDMVQRSTLPKGSWRYPRPLLTRNLPLLEAKRLLNVMDHCVPLDAEILTRDGWKRHDEVQVGDETLGYNPRTRRNEWTKILEVHRVEDAPFVRIGNKFWNATTTPNHRWRLADRDGYVTTDAVTWGSKLLLAAPAHCGDGGATPDEAALVGWLHTDGGIHRGSGRDKGRVFDARISQKKEPQRRKIEALLSRLGLPYSQRVNKTTGVATYDLRERPVRELWRALRVDELGLEGFLLTLSADAIRGFIEAVFLAEGLVNYGPYDCKQRKLAQSPGTPGNHYEELALAVYLAGHRPGRCFNSVSMCAPYVWGRSLKRTDAGRGAAWCVETTLGTWTMRQEKRICLTGNSLLQGSINFIVLAKKGDDKKPATQAELTNLYGLVQRAGRSGVLIGDHRINLEVIQPNLTEMLNPEKRRMIGRKLSQALLRVPEFGSDETGAAVQSFTELAQAVITDDRNLVIGHLHRYIWRECMKRNQTVFARTDRPLIWTPKVILQGLDFWTQYLLKLYDRGDLPRKYMVQFGGYDYPSVMAQKQREVTNGHDEIFMPPAVPYSAPGQMGPTPNPYQYGNPSNLPAPRTAAPAGGPQDNGGGRPRGATNRNGQPPDRTRPSRVVRRTQGETVRASLQGDEVVRIGELTERVLGEYPDAALGRVTVAERAALDAACTTQEGNVIVIPVNVGVAISGVQAVRLDEGFSMLCGHREPDGAIMAAAFCFREPRIEVHEAEDMVTRWGYDIGLVQADDVPSDSDTLLCPSCGGVSPIDAGQCATCGFDGPPFSLPARWRSQPQQPIALTVNVDGQRVSTDPPKEDS